jgi:predicted NBD/HSP70 family sugar kinase
MQTYQKQILVGAGIVLVPTIGWLLAKKDSKKDRNKNTLVVGIELGGTNYTVAIAEPVFNHQGEVLDFRIVKKKNGTTYQDPVQSLEEIKEFIDSSHQSVILQEKDFKPISFVGIASFGPLCLDKTSENYGAITTTPKEKWRDINVLKELTGDLRVRTTIDTDVNAAAYAEFKLGNHGVKESLAYITVGTGVGVGIIANGRTVHGLTHPEGGHIMYIPIDAEGRDTLTSTSTSTGCVPTTRSRRASKAWCVINRLLTACRSTSQLWLSSPKMCESGR